MKFTKLVIIHNQTVSHIKDKVKLVLNLSKLFY